MTFDMFSTCVKYKFKSTSYCVHTFMLFIIIMTLILPVIIIRYTGGFWIKNWSFMEKPVINFKYQYILIAERDMDNQPIICSTFLYYKESPISDDCTLMKIHEIDTDRDGNKNVLKFEARFFSDRAIRVLKLFLLFGCELKDRIHINFDTAAEIDYSLNHNIQKINFVGNLLLLQTGVLKMDANYIYSFDNVENDGFSLIQMTASNLSKIFSAKIENNRASWQNGFASDDEVVVSCEIFYVEQPIYYRLRAWEQYKWAWIQYLSIVIIFIYIIRYFISIILNKRYMKGYVVIPWKKIN